MSPCLSYEQIAAVCAAAVAALPGGQAPPLDDLVGMIGGLQEGVEPAPRTREERLAQAIALVLLQEGVDA